MSKPWVHKVAMLLISTSMVVVGYLGFVGDVQNSTTLIAAILATMVILAFSLGRQSARLIYN